MKWILLISRQVFDKVTLLHQGFQIYFGTFDGARKYFEDLGFVCPPSMSVAEFLLSVINLEKRVVRPSHQHSVPTTIEDFVGRWRVSTDYLRLRGEIEAFEQITSQQIKMWALLYQGNSLAMLTKTSVAMVFPQRILRLVDRSVFASSVVSSASRTT